MLANSYSGIVEKEVSRLVVSRARRLRVSGDETMTSAADRPEARRPEMTLPSPRAHRSTALTGVTTGRSSAHLRAAAATRNASSSADDEQLSVAAFVGLDMSPARTGGR